ncbi:conserved hypothetical protein [Formosa agariphila KMM 3901]|uniref:Uncharacterized protein n=2 Tax=Formosa TaxID=225842 RepID=T2KJL0_FORAG|nr:conserved hypothetical protein [Formosa agariphila KMM 3901]
MVLSLSVKSGSDTVLLSTNIEKPCCSLKSAPVSETQNSEHKDDNTSNDSCNPFQACCSCLLVSFHFPFTIQPNIDISTEQYFGYQSFLASQFISDFWQPPQFV